MKHLFMLGWLIASWGITAQAQLLVTGSSPAFGDASVPAESVVSFTFDQPLDTTAQFMGFDSVLPVSVMIAEPESAMELQSWNLNEDLTAISFHIIHDPDTDFIWVIGMAVSETGDSLDAPFGLVYSTSSDLGELQVEGTITINGGSPVNTLVALGRNSLFGAQGNPGICAGTIVTGNDGLYQITHVRPGVYWPVAALDVDRDGQINPDSGLDLLGFYDPDGDGVQDSIVVADNVTGLDMQMVSFEMTPATSHEFLDSAVEAASVWADDQDLVFVASADNQVGDDGTATQWVYSFHTPTGGFYTSVYVSSLFVESDTTTDWMSPGGMQTIPENYIDSDQAITVANANGGLDFVDEYGLSERFIHGGNVFWEFNQEPDQFIWSIHYIADLGDDTAEIILAVDMVTGEFIGLYWEDVAAPTMAPAQLELLGSYPNPCNPETTIRFALPRDGQVTLTVYDLLGRMIGEPENQWMTAGTNQMQINMDTWNLSSGVYFYTLQNAGVQRSSRITLVK